MKTVIFLLLIFSSIYLQAQKEENDEFCHSLLEYYQESWKADSLAQNGFRCLFYFYSLCWCPNFNFNGYEWNEVNKMLGKPNEDDGMWKTYWMEPDYPSYLRAIDFRVDSITGKVTKTVFRTE
jgi:hypothetical protein